MKPSTIVHADWGTHPTKRWYCEAGWDGNRYCVSTPSPVGILPNFLPRLLERAGSHGVLIGFDFPIGIPVAYGELIRESNFVDFLMRVGSPPYDRFFDVARTPDEISLSRPFYPFRPGGTKQIHLLSALGLPSPNDLLRRCERASLHRGRASPLFWTLGAKQVGKAAICGWRDVIRPALRNSREQIGIWPFDGALSALVGSVPCVIAETYPADACVQLGLPAPGAGWSKALQADRILKGIDVARCADRDDILLSAAVRRSIDDGFGSGADGEDQFDAFIGLIGMVRIAMGLRSDGAPAPSSLRSIEGWVLGQAC